MTDERNEKDTEPSPPDPVADAVARIEGKLDRVLAMLSRHYDHEQVQDRRLDDIESRLDDIESSHSGNGASR